ncbi:heme-degrading monooxygenase HmoA [Kribbella amoyensis]|uniref:Heme-degrading monooxygenase HmoA n=1 Tax=Kribbella amoyensis TaxID=996641 RepID=A0A561BPF4_9ACTN|nr:antibiotic biosynthesis monooxygenase [Kribbella amoyensis]TWD80750.1 heme-degrading monooxygenase HmoA [Kribbella amoyensis]
MVLEVALIDVLAGQEEAFEASYLLAREQIEKAEGARSIRMTHGIERPTRFVLLVEWDSVEAHERFRASEAFGVWRGHIGPHFANPPLVEHYADVTG